MRWRRISLNLGLVLGLSATVRAGPVMFTNVDRFLEAAGDVREIDFETLPDGTPSYWGAQITSEFNYTEQGVTFSSYIPQLEIRGKGAGDSHLTTNNPTSWRNWIIADFAPPAWTVGIVFPGHTTLSVFDGEGEHIGSIRGGGSGGGHFLGIVSDVPIAVATGDRGGSGDTWESFFFTPVPEPVTFVLLAGGAMALLFRRR